MGATHYWRIFNDLLKTDVICRELARRTRLSKMKNDKIR